MPSIQDLHDLDANEKVMAFLREVDREAPDTPITDIGPLVERAFVDDPDVVRYALRQMGTKLWAAINPEGKSKTNRRSIQRRGEGGALIQLRVDWWNVKDVSEIDQMIVESQRIARGHTMRTRDFRAIRSAMRAFPGVTAVEAARLAGVKLEALEWPAA